MKTLFWIVGVVFVLFVVYQVYVTFTTGNTEEQEYTVIKEVAPLEIRYYPAVVMAKISSSSKSYKDLGYSGFSKLANYIFGGNSDKKQIGMTSPVHMDIGDSLSTMAFVMPSDFEMENLPTPDNAEVQIEMAAPEYVAVIRFGGFVSNDKVEENKKLLVKTLEANKLSYYGNFRLLGYNPPYQLFGRRNEVVVALEPNQF